VIEENKQIYCFTIHEDNSFRLHDMNMLADDKVGNKKKVKQSSGGFIAFEGHRNTIKDICVLKGGKRLCSWDTDTNVQLWSIENTNINNTKGTLINPRYTSRWINVLFYDNNKQLMLRRGIGMEILFFGENDISVKQHTTPAISMLEMDNGKLLVSFGEKEVIVWSGDGKFLTSFDFGKEMLIILGTQVSARKNIAVFCNQSAMALFTLLSNHLLVTK